MALIEFMHVSAKGGRVHKPACVDRLAFDHILHAYQAYTTELIINDSGIREYTTSICRDVNMEVGYS